MSVAASGCGTGRRLFFGSIDSGFLACCLERRSPAAGLLRGSSSLHGSRPIRLQELGQLPRLQGAASSAAGAAASAGRCLPLRLRCDVPGTKVSPWCQVYLAASIWHIAHIGEAISIPQARLAYRGAGSQRYGGLGSKTVRVHRQLFFYEHLLKNTSLKRGVVTSWRRTKAIARPAVLSQFPSHQNFSQSIGVFGCDPSSKLKTIEAKSTLYFVRRSNPQTVALSNLEWNNSKLESRGFRENFAFRSGCALTRPVFGQCHCPNYYFYNSPGDSPSCWGCRCGEVFSVSFAVSAVSDGLIYSRRPALSRSRFHYPHRKSSCAKARGVKTFNPLMRKTFATAQRAAAW